MVMHKTRIHTKLPSSLTKEAFFEEKTVKCLLIYKHSAKKKSQIRNEKRAQMKCGIVASAAFIVKVLLYQNCW